jgi:hypothetical protein
MPCFWNGSAYLKQRRTHRNAQCLGFGRTRYYTAVIVREYNHGFVAQIRSKNFLAAGVKRIAIHESKDGRIHNASKAVYGKTHYAQHFQRLTFLRLDRRVLCGLVLGAEANCLAALIEPLHGKAVI